MTRRARELETLLLTMAAAAPLYLTYAVAKPALFAFHVMLAAIALRVAAGKGPELIPAGVMRALAIAYVPFYLVDAALISRSAIGASTHLVLFIAVYQPMESAKTNNQAQRLLTTALLVIASLATSTHITIVVFVLAFGFVMLRQLMYVSHVDTIRSIGRKYDEAPSGRAATFYLVGATLIGALLFPLLPRLRNPLVQGMSGALPGATTALSETIDFSEQRISSNDGSIVARVWMSRQAIPFFSPLRLRATVYDRFESGVWKQTRTGGMVGIPERNGSFVIARPNGITRTAAVQQRPINGRLFLPSGTYAVRGVGSLYEGPLRGSFATFQMRRGEMVNLDVDMAYAVEPLRLTRVGTSGYPVTPPVAALARSIVNDETRVERVAASIERHLAMRFRYVRDPRELGRAMTLDEFLLTVRAGHCEYFAAGMVALLTSLDVPARVVGGFHGGRLNPLTGYFSFRREDAHAWVEVWDGQRWMTYDPTPVSMRPGSMGEGLLRAYAAALSDSVNYFWDRYVLTYGLGDQVALAIEAISRTRRAVLAARGTIVAGIRNFGLPLLGLLLVGGVIFMIVRRRHRPLFHLLADHLQTLGIELGPAMTMEDALRQLREEQPEAARELEPLIRMYEEEEFSPHRDAARRRDLRKRLIALRA